MSDIRIIDIDYDSGRVTLTTDKMFVPLTEREAALQKIVVALLNTPGTMVEYPTWGGGTKRIFMKHRSVSRAETKNRIARIVQQAESSILDTEPGGREYTITSLSMLGFERLNRGVSVQLLVQFLGATSERFDLPLTLEEVELVDGERERPV